VITCVIEALTTDEDLDGVVQVEADSFSNPWTREMYVSDRQNRSMSHILIARTVDCRVAGFCAFWVVFDEVHVNNVAVRPGFRGRGIGTALLRRLLADARALGARRATLEVRASNDGARRLYERLGFHVAGVRRHYYTHPTEDALILWREDVPGDQAASG
jgi:ribosomal-protein-alanine N-acetyltransferase